ncbi:MAG: GNAT family N-acetyltransferase [Lachnospiraceae bacterium]|nr:GNAT family N-acetyltransferase [Lachnospiraceae bacterium]
MVSACLAGENCKYNGGNNRNGTVLQLMAENEVITVCPEQMGGLPTPRVPSEIRDGVVTAKDGRIIGAVWTRIMNDYGHVDDETPSFAISLFSEYRGQGIGTRLMKEMLSLLKEHGYRQASLAVQKANNAVRMYRNVGFEIIDENDEEYIMVCRL